MSIGQIDDQEWKNSVKATEYDARVFSNTKCGGLE